MYSPTASGRISIHGLSDVTKVFSCPVLPACAPPKEKPATEESVAKLSQSSVYYQLLLVYFDYCSPFFSCTVSILFRYVPAPFIKSVFYSLEIF